MKEHMCTTVPQNVAKCLGLSEPVYPPNVRAHTPKEKNNISGELICSSAAQLGRPPFSHTTVISQTTLSSAKYCLIYSCFFV
jgi:hypothetical protein